MGSSLGSRHRASAAHRRRRAAQTALFLVVLGHLVSACGARPRPTHPELTVAANRGDALALSDALEALIAGGRDTPTDREYAYEMVRRSHEDTAAYYFARAAVTGRLVQLRGLQRANLVPEIEASARRSRELDPHFRDGAATRLLGTLYVVAPAMLLEHGSSEDGIELLEALVEERPDVIENHLRLAEAYISLGDPVPACPHLRRCLAQRTALRPDEQRLLDQLVDAAGPLPCDDVNLPAGD
jgi:hypothetical protein